MSALAALLQPAEGGGGGDSPRVAPAREGLAALKNSELQARAIAAGMTQEQEDDVNAADDRKLALVEVVVALEAAAAPRPPAQPPAGLSAGGGRDGHPCWGDSLLELHLPATQQIGPAGMGTDMYIFLKI